MAEPEGLLQSGDTIETIKEGKIPNNYGLTGNSYIDYSNAPGMFGLNNGQWNNLGQLSGLAGTAFNVYDNLWGNKADMYKTQMAAMKQNMANIAEDRANRKAFVGNFGSGVNSALGGGLAASAVKI